MNFEDSCPQPAADEVRRLIEGSPLGTPGARAVRNRIPREQAESVVARLRARRAAQYQGAANGDDQTGIPAGSVLSEDASVASPVAAADVVKVDKLSESQLQALEDSFFGRPLGEILQIEGESRDRRRQEILENLAASIEDVTRVSAAQVTREAVFVNDLGIDSLTALELGVQVEEAYGIRIAIEDLAGLHTVGDAVDFIEETAWLRGRRCAVWDLTVEQAPWASGAKKRQALPRAAPTSNTSPSLPAAPFTHAPPLTHRKCQCGEAVESGKCRDHLRRVRVTLFSNPFQPGSFLSLRQPGSFLSLRQPGSFLSLRQVPIMRSRASNPKGSGQFSNWLPSLGEPSKLLLSLGIQLGWFSSG